MAEAVSMALARKLGKMRAHALIARATKRALEERIHLRLALGEDEEIAPHFDAATLERLFDPQADLGASEQMIAAALKKKF